MGAGLLGDLTVAFKIDLSGLTGGITQAKEEMSSLSGASSSVSSGITSGLTGAISSFVSFGAQVGQAVFGVEQLAGGAVSLANALLQPDASMEQMTVAFTQLLGSSTAAKNELQDLSTFAAQTPFQMPDLANATQKLLAFQIPLSDTKPLITAMGDALSGLGKNTPAMLDQVVNVFGQMNAAGKIQTQDLMQLTSVGINGFQMLADQMHKPVAVIKEMVTSGTIPATQGIEMLRAGMEKTFGGGMAAQAQTFNGLISTFQDNVMSAYRAFSGPLFDAAKAGLTQLGNLVSSPAFQAFATELGTNVGGALKSLLANLAPVGQFLQGIANNWQDVIESINFGPLIQAAQHLFATMSQSNGPALFMVLLNNISNLAASLVGPLTNLATAGIEYVTQRMKAMQPVGQALLTGISGIVLALQNFLPPLIDIAAHLLSWYTSSGLATTGTGLLVDGITALSTILSGLINGLGQVLSLFTQNTAGGQILRDILIGVGVAIAAIQLGALLATLPAIITGFTLWASEAIITAVATTIAMAPIVLIGLAIAAVIAIVILSIQNWGAISKWLQGAWSNTVSFFAGIWASITGFFGGIGQWFQDRFTEASNGVKTGFQGVKDWFGGVGQWFNDQGKIQADNTKTGLKSISDNYMAMAHSAADSMIWLYNHNYYVKAAVDGIVKWVQDAVAWLQTTWTGLTTFISSQWQALTIAATLYWGIVTSFISQQVQTVQTFITSIWTALTGWIGQQWAIISTTATLYWSAISLVVQAKLQEMQAFVTSILTAVSGWIGAQWNTLAGMATSAWQAVSAVFSGIWTTYISGPLGSLWNQITGWFTNLGTQAYQSGTNFISMLVSGIQSGAGSVWNAVVGIANQIWAALGFHSPAKAGPGADADKWMPNLVNMLSSSLIAQQPKMSLAVQTVAQPLSFMKMNTGSYPALYGGSSAPLQGASTPSVIENHTHVYLDGNEISHIVGNNMMRETRQRTGMKI